MLIFGCQHAMNLQSGRSVSPIKDIVHDYIPLTSIEREIVDDPLFQRLHFVLQNSVAFVGFPCNKNTRFVHSLGVAHLAGNMFVKALERASSETLAEFLREAEHLTRGLAAAKLDSAGSVPRIVRAWEREIGNSSRFAHEPVDGIRYRVERFGEDGSIPALFLINTYWLVVRICGLAHDIGHLPMSHSFEHALSHITDLFDLYRPPGEEDQVKHDALYREFRRQWENQSSAFISPESDGHGLRIDELVTLLGVERATLEEFVKSAPIHERRGFMILDVIRRRPTFFQGELRESYNRDQIQAVNDAKEYGKFLFSCAQLVLLSGCYNPTAISVAPPDGAAVRFLSALKRIIAGEVEADRLDYTLRDGLASGMGGGSFDVGRIIDNVILCKNGRGEFVFAFTDRAVGAIEQFFQQRYEAYKYIIYQRTACRSEACLRELIGQLYLFAYRDPEGEISKLMEHYGYLRRGGSPKFIETFLPSTVDYLERLDDANLRTLLFAVFDWIIHTYSLADTDSGEVDFEQLSPEIATLYLLLRVVLFRDFRHLLDPMKAFNIFAGHKDIGDIGSPAENSRWDRIHRGWQNKLERVAAVERLRKETVSCLKGRGIALVSDMPPKVFDAPRLARTKPSDDVFIKDRNYEHLVPICDKSPFLKDMWRRKDQDLSLWVSFLAPNAKSSRVTRELLLAEFQIFMDDLEKAGETKTAT